MPLANGMPSGIKLRNVLAPPCASRKPNMITLTHPLLGNLLLDTSIALISFPRLERLGAYSFFGAALASGVPWLKKEVIVSQLASPRFKMVTTRLSQMFMVLVLSQIDHILSTVSEVVMLTIKLTGFSWETSIFIDLLKAEISQEGILLIY